MENVIEKTKIEIVRMKDDGENGDLGTTLMRSLVPSHFYIVEKTPEMATSFCYNLTAPAAVYTITKSLYQFFGDLIGYDGGTKSKTSGFEMDEICKKTKVLENKPLWIDDTEFENIAELCEKSRQMKEEHHVQFVIIDDLQNLPALKQVQEGDEKPDTVCQQLCQLAKELDVVVLGFTKSSEHQNAI